MCGLAQWKDNRTLNGLSHSKDKRYLSQCIRLVGPEIDDK